MNPDSGVGNICMNFGADLLRSGEKKSQGVDHSVRKTIRMAIQMVVDEVVVCYVTDFERQAKERGV